MIWRLWLLVYLIVPTCAFNQQTPSLGIGSTLPDTTLGFYLEDSSRQLKTADLKGAPAILVLWDRGCSACLYEMPHLDSVQQRLGKKVRIVLVTSNTAAEIKASLGKVKIKKPDLEMVVSKLDLPALFAYNTVPHHVWVNAEGVIRYITVGEHATIENVGAFVKGEKLSLPYKREFADFDRSQPLLTEGGGRLLMHLKSYSLLMDRVEFSGGSYGMRWDSVQRRGTVKMLNQRLLFLYRYAYGQPFKGGIVPKNRVVYHLGKGYAPLPSGSNAPLQEVYCYELHTPAGKLEQLYHFMQQDLQRNFSYKATIQKVPAKYLVIQAATDGKKIQSKGGKPLFTKEGDYWVVRNQNPEVLSSLISKLLPDDQKLLIEVTGITGKIDLRLKEKSFNLASLKRALNAAGLRVEEKEKMADMLVIYDE